MKKILASVALFVAAPVFAASQTAILSVPAMSCASCPLTIKAALLTVPGVTSVKSDLAQRQTTVVYDSAKTDLAALSKATADAGFPSTPAKASR